MLALSLVGCGTVTPSDQNGGNEGGTNEGENNEGDTNERMGTDDNEPAAIPSDILLTYSNITLALSDAIELPASVTIDGEERPLTYSVEGAGVTISGNTLIAKSVSDDATVTATADKFTSSIAVTVIDDAAPDGTNISNSGWYVMKDGSVVNSATYTANKANALTENFVVSGRVDINRLAGSAHLQFRFNSSKRFLLWDSNMDGFIGIGYTDGSSTVSELKNTTPYIWKFDDKISLRWTVIVNGTDAYLYINDFLVKQLAGVTPEGFNLGTLYMDADFYNISVVTKEANAGKYAEILSAKGLK